MAKPQQPELERSGHGATDPASTKTHVQVEPGGKGGTGTLTPVPEDNRPGHHPDTEQDKPTARFAARARRLAEEAGDGGAEQGPLDAERVMPGGAREVQPGRGPGRGPGPVATVLTGTVPLVALVDAVRRPESAWEEAGHPRTAWLAGIALVPGVGSWLYATRVRPRLRAAEVALSLRGG